MDLVTLMQAVLVGAGMAAFAAAVGYGKKRFKAVQEGNDPQAFVPSKFFEVVIYGAVFGGVAGGAGIDVTAAENLVVTLGLLPALSYWVPALARFAVRGLRALKAKLLG